MKKNYVVFLCLFVLGCLTDGNDNEKNIKNDFAGSSSYLPIKLNATWAYASKSGNLNNSYNQEITDTIKGTKSIGGKTYWMMVSATKDDYDSYSDTTYFRIQDNIYYNYIENLFPSLLQTTKNSMAHKITAIGNQEVTFLKFGAPPLTTWDILKTSYTDNEVSFIFEMSGKSLGSETVQCSSVTFENCVKFEITLNSKFTFNNETLESTTKTTMWFAPNVGNVKNYNITDNYIINSDEINGYKIP